MESMKHELKFCACQYMATENWVSYFSLWEWEKKNLNRSISSKETEMVTEVFLAQKATAWGGFTWEF